MNPANNLRRRVTVLTCGFVLIAVSALPGEARPSGTGGGPKGTDLAVTMSDSPDPVVAGTELTYTILAKNRGPETATGVQVTDSLPAGVTWKQTISTKGSCEPSTCLIGTLSKNQSATITITVVPNSSGTLTNQVTIGGNQSDPTAANNAATVTTTVTVPPPPPNPEADLEVSVTDDPDPYVDATFPEGGDPLDEPGLTYTITVSNHGRASAIQTLVTDTLPERAGVRSMPSFCAVSLVGTSFWARKVTCHLASIDPGSHVDIPIVVGFCGNYFGPVQNTVEVTSESPDRNATNNTATEETTLLRAKRFMVELCPAVS